MAQTAETVAAGGLTKSATGLAKHGARSLVGLLVLAGGVLSATLAPAAFAQKAFPEKQVRLVVAFGAGGSSDTVARTLAQKLAEMWGQNVVVENRTGATGTIAADLVARAPGDGYTLLFTSALSTAAALYPKLPFDWQRDLTAIVQTSAAPQVLYVHPSLPVKSVKELIAFARKRPGELSYGSSGIGSVAHLSGANMAIANGLTLIHVPYKSNVLASTDVVGGYVPMMFDQLATALPHVRAGKVRPLAVTAGQRVAQLPDVPTMIESGFKDFETTIWHGILGPASLQKDVLARINSDVNRVLKMADVRDRLTALGLQVIGGSPEAFTAEMKKDHAWASSMIKAVGIRPE